MYEEVRRKSLIDFDNITKAGALESAQMLAHRINFMNDDKHINDILYHPFAFEDFDKQDIKMRLNCLVPENMYVIYHSKLLNQLYKAHPEKFKKERFYSKLFMIEKLP